MSGPFSQDVMLDDPATARRASAPLRSGNRYELRELIAAGATGEVRAAYDLQIGRDVAIKRMHDGVPSEDQQALFLREARIQGRLEHPAIPPVHDIGAEADGRPFFVMKKLGGTRLSEVLADRSDARSRQQLLRSFVEVCRALDLAHARRIVHRDIKPASVLLGPAGEVYVLDWGFARELDANEVPSPVIRGTPGYRAPEQWRREPDVDARADVYSLGCVLYEILAGESLRPDRGEPPAPREDIAPELDRLWRRATEPDRAQRLATARELADAVERYLHGERDLAARRELASRHFALAVAALTGADDEATRRATAMRHAGRAIALDPTLEAAAELVAQLMLTAPVTPPREVAESVAALDDVCDRRTLLYVVRVSMVNFAMFPLLWLLGIHDRLYLGALGGLAIANTGLLLLAARYARLRRGGWPLALLLGLAWIAVTARMYSPFLIAPGFCAVSIMAFAVSSPGRSRRIIMLCATSFILVVLGVWLCELCGWLDRTFWFDGNSLVVHPPITILSTFPAIAALCIHAVLLITSAVAIAYTAHRNHVRARTQVHLQAWQLRQLV